MLILDTNQLLSYFNFKQVDGIHEKDLPFIAQRLNKAGVQADTHENKLILKDAATLEDIQEPLFQAIQNTLQNKIKAHIQLSYSYVSPEKPFFWSAVHTLLDQAAQDLMRLLNSSNLGWDVDFIVKTDKSFNQDDTTWTIENAEEEQKHKINQYIIKTLQNNKANYYNKV